MSRHWSAGPGRRCATSIKAIAAGSRGPAAPLLARPADPLVSISRAAYPSLPRAAVARRRARSTAHPRGRSPQVASCSTTAPPGGCLGVGAFVRVVAKARPLRPGRRLIPQQIATLHRAPRSERSMFTTRLGTRSLPNMATAAGFPAVVAGGSSVRTSISPPASVLPQWGPAGRRRRQRLVVALDWWYRHAPQWSPAVVAGDGAGEFRGL
jgi:hypothetical protein